MKETKLIPIREFEVLDDEMLSFITAGATPLSVTADCSTNTCKSNSGTCNINRCGINTANCGTNNCSDNNGNTDHFGGECKDNTQT